MAERNAPAKGERIVRAQLGAIEKEAGGDGRRLARFVASDETVDRYGDIIRASGWQLDNFRKNPVLLWSHRSGDLPIGRVEPIAVEGKSLIAHCQLLDAGTTPFCDMVWGLLEQGALNAVSVGFLPLADPVPIFDANKQLTGFEFVAQELLELSVTPVPANPNALQLARSFALTDQERQVLFIDHGNAAAVAAQSRAALITDLRYRRTIA